MSTATDERLADAPGGHGDEDDRDQATDPDWAWAAEGTDTGHRAGDAAGDAARDDSEDTAAGGFAGCSAAERREAIEQLAALVAATQAQLAALLVASGDAGDWRTEGGSSESGWASLVTGSTQDHAAELLRVGRALAHLPLIAEAFAAGRLSWDKVRQAVRFVDPDTEEVLFEDLLVRSADEVRLLANQHRRITKKDACRDRDQAVIRFRRDAHDRGKYMTAWLPGDLAARVESGMRREADALGPDAETGVWASLEHRYALVLDSWAARRLGEDPDRDRTTLVVGVRAEQLAGVEDGNGWVGDDIVIGLETVLRLACTAKVEFQVESITGTVVGIRRVDREPPAAMRRAMHRRDQRCRWPGCNRSIRHFHHVRHWSKGGPTNSDNLLGLCWHHHHLVHEGGWKVEGDANRTVTFVAPDGRRLSSDPPGLRPEVAHRARRAARARRAQAGV
jgi:hypothetical protein